MTDEKKMKVEFAPGVLEGLEAQLSPDELQSFLDTIKAKIEDGSFLEESHDIDFDSLQQENPEEYEALMKAIESFDPEEILNNKKPLN